jgi:hypothetical protein
VYFGDAHQAEDVKGTSKVQKVPTHQAVNWTFQNLEVPVLKKRLKKIELFFKHVKGLALDIFRFSASPSPLHSAC